ncbi:MAG: cation:proton antiporter [Helicobacteraceae bacterium]|jgi:CPA2 family monovalent cation:H+ antiporter-2|nr:cation:proton antiporter [Helicobacteraceae bacterium]
MDSLLIVVVCTTFLAVVLNIRLKKLDITPVIGYIASGAIVSQIFAISGEHHTLDQIGEFGIVFLMFTIGLEFSLSYLRAMRRELFLFGVLQITLTAIVFSVIAIAAFDVEAKAAVVFACALAMSSTAIVLKILKERGEIGKPFGKQVLGILIFQDIAVIPVLLMVTLFSQPNADPVTLILKIAASGAIVLILLSTFGKFFITKLLEKANETQTHEIFIGAVLLIVVATALLAHQFGFSYSLGALIAGILIAKTRYKYQVEADLAPFRDLLLGVFFVTVGLQIDLSLFATHFISIFAIVIGVMLMKALVIYAFARFLGEKSAALRTSIALMQMGEFGFAIFAIASQAGILPDKTLLAQLSLAVAISMVLTPFILKNLEKIARIFERGATVTETNVGDFVSAEVKGHIIVVGYGFTIGRQIAQLLKEREIPYICIEEQYKKVEEGSERGHAVILGNAAQRAILERTGVKNAAAVIVTFDKEEDIRLIAEAVHEANPDVAIVVKSNQAMSPTFFDEISFAMFVDEHREAALLMISRALKNHAQPPERNVV